MEKIQLFLEEEANKWPGVKVYYRDSWKSDYYDLEGKCIALCGKNKEGQKILTIKGKPEHNKELREQYPFVVPGYYMNKTHWNSILLEKSTFNQEELLKLLKESYAIIFSSLTKKRQKEILLEFDN